MSPQEKREKKLALDEQTFQQLLESAYVLQRHNDAAQAGSSPAPDSLAEILETQRIIQSQKLDLPEAAELIAVKTRSIMHASGSAIGIVERNRLICVAASGNGEDETGSQVPVEQSIAAPVLIQNSSLWGKILLCPDVNTTPELNATLCQARGIRSLILVPVQYDGKVEGVLEVHSTQPNAFDSQDVRRVELLASLLREAIARAAEMEWKQTLAAERATMLQALDAIQPQIEKLVSPAISSETIKKPADVPETDFSAASFAGEAEPVFSSSRLQSEFATPLEAIPPKPAPEPVPEEMLREAGIVLPPVPSPIVPTVSNRDSQPVQAAVMTNPPAQGAPATPPWTSADLTRQWLEALRPKKSNVQWLSKQWHAHRANFYLAFSALLLLAVLSGWGTRSANTDASANTSASVKNPAKPQLSLFERSLVAMGLADPPPAPPDTGNPSAKVWIDLHTALYYCSDSPIYGKTPGGKYSLQRDAQLDQFEPANKQPCP